MTESQWSSVVIEGLSDFDGRNEVCYENGQWFYGGSSDIRYDSIEDYIEANLPEPEGNYWLNQKISRLSTLLSDVRSH